MAYDIGPKIGIDGEAEFRQAINGINDNLKTLGTEMKSAMSEFDKGDKSVEALGKQNEVLNKQIDEQRKKLEELNKGLDASADKYGENDKITQGWQRSVNQATTDLNNMERELKNNTDAMEKSSKESESTKKQYEDVTEQIEKLARQYVDVAKEEGRHSDNAKDLKNQIEDLTKVQNRLADELNDDEKAFKDVTSGVKKYGDNAKDAEKDSLSLGDIIKANLISDAIIGGVKALGSAMLSVASGAKEAVLGLIDSTSELSDMSQRTGVGAEELQKYAYAAQMSGLEMGQLEKAMTKSQKSFADAKDGSKSLQEAYSKLGVNINDISNSEDAFDATLKALADMDDEVTRNALANDLFGKSYADLAPLLNEGSTGIEDLKKKAEDLGIVMSEDAVNSGEALGDTLETIQMQMDGVKNNILSALLPGLSDLATKGSEFIGEFAGKMKETDGDMSQMGEVVGSTLSDLVGKVAEKLPEFIEGAKSLISSFAGGIKENLPMIIETGMEIITDLATTLIESLPEIIKTGLEIIVSLANGIADSLPELIPTIVDTIILIVETLIDNLDKLIDAALEIILALAEGLIDALPRLIEKIPVIIEKLVAALVKNGPKILEAGIELVVMLGSGLIKAIPQLVKSIPKIVSTILDGLGEGLSKIGDIGKNLVQGLWNGISDATAWIVDKVKGFGSSVLGAIKGFFGIHSPSSVFRDEIGKNLALGLGEGFTKEMGNVSKDINDSIPTDFDVKGAYDMSVSGSVDNNLYNALAAVAQDIIVPAILKSKPGTKIEGEIGRFFKAVQTNGGQLDSRAGLSPA